MKKRFILLLSAVIIFGLSISACSKPKDPAEEIKDPAEGIMERMTLRQKVGQLFIVRPDALNFALIKEQIDSPDEKGVKELTEEMLSALSEYPIGGVALFGKNIESPEQLRKFTSELKTVGDIPLFLAVDEEGGRVARLANTESFDLPKYFSAFDTEDAEEMGRTIGAYLYEYGFNIDFAPVVDVNSNPDNPVIGKRAFSDDALTVREKAALMASGLQENGIMPVYKHFPGHGDTAEDTHLKLAVVHKTVEQLNETEWVPYKNLEFPAVMVAHVAVPEAGVAEPASLSYTVVTEWLRGLLGHEGLVITDSLSMGAITNEYSSKEACIKAVEAGVDILLMPTDLAEAMDGVEQAVLCGQIPESRIDESVHRILKAKMSLGLLDIAN